MRINWLGIIISAVFIVALRYLWYAHFGGADWGRLLPSTISAIQGGPQAAGLELVDALLISFGLSWVAGLAGRSAGSGLSAGLAAAVLFGLTTLAEPFINGGPLKALLIDGGFMLVAYAVGGLIIGATAPKRVTRSKINWGAELPAGEH